MHIQINAPHRTLPDSFVAHVENRLNEALAPHAKRLSRLEVHFQDLNGQKGGIDKRCLLEARPRGLDPVAAEDLGEAFEGAFRGALEKLQRVLERRFGRLSSRD